MAASLGCNSLLRTFTKFTNLRVRSIDNHIWTPVISCCYCTSSVEKQASLGVNAKPSLKEPGNVTLKASKHAADIGLPPLGTLPFGNPEESPVIEKPKDPTDHYRERFIPITRRSIIRHLMQEPDFLTEDEKKKFEAFAHALDSAVVNKYHGLLEELKTLFDPINPDKDTVGSRKLNRRQRLDTEFWLLQKLAVVMDKANFHELPATLVSRTLDEHVSREGVTVSVNTDRYDVMKFWALGKETPKLEVTRLQRLAQRFLRRTRAPPNIDYYKRVVAATRLKTDDKLMLKAFKEIPCNALEQLLPDGQVKMSNFDRTLLYTMLGCSALGVFAKLITWLAHYQIEWTLIMAVVFGLGAVRSWTVYKNRHSAYLVDLSRMLYFKNIANNRSLLTLLVDRAEDETFKEALLCYAFLLKQRPPSAAQSAVPPAGDYGGIPAGVLESRVEEWVRKNAGIGVIFDSLESIKLLQSFCLLRQADDDDLLYVVPLDVAMRSLPQQPQTLVKRVEESDIVEGYERDIKYEESEADYKKTDKKKRRFGWW